MTKYEKVRGRGEKPQVNPKRYYAWNPTGERQRDPVRLTLRNKERYERMGWTFEAVHR